MWLAYQERSHHEYSGWPPLLPRLTLRRASMSTAVRGGTALDSGSGVSGWARGMGRKHGGVSGNTPQFVLAGRRMETQMLALLALVFACRDDAAGGELVVVAQSASNPDPSSRLQA